MTTHDDDALRDVLAEARALLANVTGEWKYIQYIEEVVTVDTGRVVADLGWDCMTDNDARLIAAAPRLLRALADECDALRAANLKLVAERLKVAHENYEAGFQDAIDDFKHAAAPEPPSRGQEVLIATDPNQPPGVIDILDKNGSLLGSIRNVGTGTDSADIQTLNTEIAKLTEQLDLVRRESGVWPCPTCDGTGTVSAPDRGLYLKTTPCPVCQGKRVIHVRESR